MINGKSTKFNVTRRNFLKTIGASSAGMMVNPDLFSGIVSASPNANPTVATASVSSYDEAQLTRAVENSLENLGGLGDIVKQGDKVGIKINLTGGTPHAVKYLNSSGNQPGDTYWTHPVLLKVVGQALKDAGAAELYILEAIYDWESVNDFGYKEVIDYLGATFIDINEKAPYGDYITKSVGDKYLIYPELTFNGIFNELDCFVSMPKAKQHASAGITHGMKNLIGTLPIPSGLYNDGAGHRAAIHNVRTHDGNPKNNLCRVILDLNRANPIHLVVNDAIKTVLGSEGPWTSRGIIPFEFNKLIIGKDPVAVDSVSTSIMGYDPMAEDYIKPYVTSINYLKLASEEGLGEYDLEKINVIDYITDVEEIETQLPNSIELKQNYPNPFNPSTTIEFNVDKSMDINLTIYDMQGQEVAVLHDGIVSAGNHKFNWNGNKTASGVYYYRITAGKYNQTKQMSLVK